MITSGGTLPSGFNGRLTNGLDDATPAWSFGNTDQITNPNGKALYVAFARGTTSVQSSPHDIDYLSVIKSVNQGLPSTPESNQAGASFQATDTDVYAINCGGPAVTQTAPLPNFAADEFFKGLPATPTLSGAPVQVTGAPAVNTANVIPPVPPAGVYQAFRQASLNSQGFEYVLPNLNTTGQYNLLLHFVEINTSP